MSKPSKLVDRIGQFTTVPNSVVKMWAAIGLDAFALFVYLRYRSDEHDECFPSYDLIQAETSLTRRRIAAAVRKLEDAGLVERKRRFGNSTVYVLKIPSISNTGGLMESAPLVTQVDCISNNAVLPLVQGVHTNQTHLTRLIKLDPIPDELNCPAFVSAWDRWNEYRKEIKKKLTPATAAAQLKKLAQVGPDTAAAMIDQSIENGWQGLFPLKQSGGAPSNGRAGHTAIDPVTGRVIA